MPASARSAQVDLDATRYYHCISRCVRRAFLCGADPYTGRSFEHRKTWLLERLRRVANAFTIDVCAYAILSNHFHVVLRVDPERAAALTDEAVIRRYGMLFRRAAAEARELPPRPRAERIATFRERLSDISWFMRAVNEPIARRANKEDEVTGRFWEGRFKSQALLDETAVLTAMSYVDLNPVRAGVAAGLEDSDFTSIQQRLREAAGEAVVAIPLARCRRERRGRGATLPIRLDDYVELVEWTGRAAGAKRGGRIRGRPPAALGQLGVNPEAWLALMRLEGMIAVGALGAEERMSVEAERRGVRWLRGKRAAVELYVARSA